MNVFKKIARKGKLIVAGAVVAVAMATAATVFVAPATVNAAGCDKVNIIHCGLDGSTVNGYIDSLQKFYNKNSDNGHNDLQAVYNWAGLSDTNIKNMSSSNTKIGTLYRSGDVKVDGKVVATDAWVTARFSEGKGFEKIRDGVWARKTTTSFEHSSAKVLVHYVNGQVDSVVMIDCGNAVKVTPVKVTPPPAPKPVLKCVLLRGSTTSVARTYSYTATASATNTTIQSYTFKFSDGTSQTVATSAATAKATHTFPAYSTRYVTNVFVNGATQKNVTGTSCVSTVTTPPAPVKPTLTCDSLTYVPALAKPLTYSFIARATPVKTTITSYEFTINGVKQAPVVTSAHTTNILHTFDANDKVYSASVVVNSADFNNVTSTACAINITTPKADECKPGIPVGDARCTDTPPAECVPTETQDENCEELDAEEEPEELVNAGPGAVVGLFAGTSVIGAAAHQIIRRRNHRD